MSVSSSRRQFLRGASSLGALSALSLPACLSAATEASASADGYKALVCIHLQGGNDAFNTLIPYDAASNANYLALRGYASDASPGLGIPASALENFRGPSQGGLQVAFNPSLKNIFKLRVRTTSEER